MSQERTGLVILALAILVLLYFSAGYLLAFIVDVLKNSPIIPGVESYEKETYIGYLKSIPQIIGIALSILWGILADKIGRRKTMSLMIMFMFIGLAIIPFAVNYTMLLTLFIIFGIGHTGIAPIVYAFIADVLVPEKRGAGYAVYYASSVLGFIGAYVFYLAVKPWQTTYGVLGVMVLLTGLLLLAVSRGVRIGGAEKTSVVEFKLSEAVSSFRKPSVMAVLVMIVFWTIPWGMLTTFAIDYMMVKWGVSKTIASLILIVSVVSIAIGHIVGGILSDKVARKKGPAGRVFISILGIGIGLPVMLSMIMYPYPCGNSEWSIAIRPLLLAAFGMMFTTIAYPNITVVLSDVVRAEHRGTVFSVYNILNTLGWAIGPLLYPALAYIYMPPDIRASDLPRLITLYDPESMRYINSCMSEMAPVRNAYMYSAATIVLLWIISLLIWIVIKITYEKDRIYN